MFCSGFVLSTMAEVPENPTAGGVVAAIQAEENNAEDNAAAADAPLPVAQEVSLFLFFRSVSFPSFVPGLRLLGLYFYFGFLAFPFVSCFIFFSRFPT